MWSPDRNTPDRALHNLHVFQPATVAGTTLKPGQYKVEWTGPGAAVNAEFKLNGKTVATVPATVSELTKSSQPSATVMQTEEDGTAGNHRDRRSEASPEVF